MTEYNPKTRLWVGGSMSKEGADRAGCLLAIAAVIFASGAALGFVLYGLAALLK